MNLVSTRHRCNGPQRHHGGEHSWAHQPDEINHVFDRCPIAPSDIRFPDCPTKGFDAGVCIQLAETDHEITIKAGLPGIDPTDVKIGVMGNRLEIRGQESNWQEAEKENRHAARQSGRFNRTVQLPVSVVPDEVDAAYKDGVLTIRLPRREDARTKRILHLSA